MPLDTGGFKLAGQLFDHILQVVVRTLGPNNEAFAIFDAITLMFDGSNSGENVVVDPYLVHNLAACARVSLNYDEADRIPWGKNDHDAIIVRTLVGMVRTLITAVKTDRVSRRDGKVFFGHFEIPDWLIREAGR